MGNLNGKELFIYLTNIIQNYGNDYLLKYEKIKCNVVRTEYATGGEVLYHGFYCPNPVVDLVVGNGSRGRLLKSMTSRSRPTFTYGFDTNNRMITCEHEGCLEYLIYEENRILGIEFNPDPEFQRIQLVTECVYDKSGRILTILHGNCFYPYPMDLVETDSFLYDEGGIQSMVHDEWMDTSDKHLSRCRVTLHHDTEGFLSSYDWEDYNIRKHIYGPKRCGYPIQEKCKI